MKNCVVVRLDPAQVVEAWDMLKKGFLISLPVLVKASEWTLANLQSALMDGRLTAWMISEIKGNEVKLLGIATTVFTSDTLAGLKYMYVYSLASFGPAPDGVWRLTFETLMKYAKHMNCNYLSAYTSHPGLLALAKDLGANTDLTLVVKELN